ncbi:hypothetical protein [Paenibacillus piri]|uniref:Uncharacterized protein n=1 Tax=Paenibacillus piri TaxID=2547395 RepID=A0A4R5KYR8_9BACL|nr:hypothetical protein [Paenibacillus piri]TDG00288.1 hypothetical protein E1757_01190 [Paenibacillus piri]
MKQMRICDRQAVTQWLLSLLDCRMSITGLCGKPVQSRYGIVQVMSLSPTEMVFSCPWILPVNRGLTLSFELTAGPNTIRFSGSQVIRLDSVELQGCRYRVRYDIGGPDRIWLLFAVNRQLSESRGLMAAALNSYTAYDPGVRPANQLDMQL